MPPLSGPSVGMMQVCVVERPGPSVWSGGLAVVVVNNAAQQITTVNALFS